VPLVVQELLPEVVTAPHSKGPEPTNMWFAIGSNVAAVSAGLVVMRLGGVGELGVQPDQPVVQLTTDPVRVY
jgi:hypothetical protein